jgi:hypothetical protein
MTYEERDVECYINVFKSVYGVKPRVIPPASEILDATTELASSVDYDER